MSFDFFLSTTADKSDLIDVEFQLQFFYDKSFFFHNFCLKYYHVRQLIIQDLFLVVSGKPESPVFSLGTFFFERQELKPFYVLSVTAFLIEIRKWALKIFSKSLHVGGHGFDSFQ